MLHYVELLQPIFMLVCKWIYNDHKKLPNSGDLVGVTPHPSDPTQAFPHTSYPHWGILMWEGPLPNNIIWIWKAWVTWAGIII